jgi:hypothetical protein
MSYADWVAWVQQIGGTATTWPFADGNSGQPAARFTAAQYAALAGMSLTDPTGSIQFAVPVTEDPSNGIEANTAGSLVYVLASTMTGDNSVAADLQSTGATIATMATPSEIASGSAVSLIGQATGGVIPSLPSVPDMEAGLVTAAKWVGVGLVAYLVLEKAL